MTETLGIWTGLILAFAAFIAAVKFLLQNILELIDIWKKIPVWLLKFLIYVLTLVIPNTIIIWRFFYFAGLYSNRLSEPIFFWSMIIQSALGVSMYEIAWLTWVYSGIDKIPKESPSSEPEDKPRRYKKSSKSGGKNK